MWIQIRQISVTQSILCLLAIGMTLPLYAKAKPPVNLVDYSKQLASAGQPNADYFDVLAKQGYEIVINIAPPTSHGALKDEGYLVGALGMTYLNIPVDWDNPTLAEFRMFQKFMKNNPDSRVFLHCQMNMRASAYAFLHLVINLGESPKLALADLHRVWIPNKTWTGFMNSALSDYEVDFSVPYIQKSKD